MRSDAKQHLNVCVSIVFETCTLFVFIAFIALIYIIINCNFSLAFYRSILHVSEDNRLIFIADNNHIDLCFR